MSDTTDPLVGFFEKHGLFARQAIERIYPSSAISLTALRETKPELAKQIFVEGVLAPVRGVLGKHLPKRLVAEALERLEGIEARFRQESLVNLLYEVEVIVASRLIHGLSILHEAEAEKMFGPLRDGHGRLTGGSMEFLRFVVNDVAWAIGELASLRERKVQLLFAAALAGPEAVHQAIQTYGGYRKGAALESLWGWLKCSISDDAERRRLVDGIAQGSEKQIERTLRQLEGTAFLDKETIQIIVDEIFTGEKHIKF